MIILAWTLQLRHSSTPMFSRSMTLQYSSFTCMTWPSRSGFHDNSVSNSESEAEISASAKCRVIFKPAAFALANESVKMRTSPLAGSPQRSMPTTPVDEYLMHRSTTSSAWATVLRRSTERIRYARNVFVLSRFHAFKMFRTALT